MIKAIYREGRILPLDEVPADWEEGQELFVESLGSNMTNESFEQWVAEMDAASSEISEEDHDRMEAALAEIETRSKEQGRREMGRSQGDFLENLNPSREAG